MFRCESSYFFLSFHKYARCVYSSIFSYTAYKIINMWSYRAYYYLEFWRDQRNVGKENCITRWYITFWSILSERVYNTNYALYISGKKTIDYIQFYSTFLKNFFKLGSRLSNRITAIERHCWKIPRNSHFLIKNFIYIALSRCANICFAAREWEVIHFSWNFVIVTKNIARDHKSYKG